MASILDRPETVIDQPLPTTDIEQGKRDLDRYGYAIHEDALSPAEVDVLRSRLLEQAELECEQGVASYRIADPKGESIADRNMGRPPADAPICWQAILALVNKGREFIDLTMSPLVAEYGKHILKDTPFYLAQSTGIIVRKGSGGQVMHIDHQPVPFNIEVPIYYNAMIALTDFEPEMGSTRVVPGSHLFGRRPEFVLNTDTNKVVSRETVRSVPIVCRAGSVIVFESRLWHFQGDAVSDRTRLSILNGYCMHFIRAQDDYIASLQDDVYDALSEDERKMMGFEVVSEYTGRYYPRHAEDRRRNTNARYAFIPELRRGGIKKAQPFADMGSDEH